ncbi:hypothetical protein [Paenibacillus medicaginis]|uniref:DUF11 domain-containing protein n=1 Tax=Paenibacillus medicaginis TaxID=1470560 RepID=A0ABV5C4V4_9BACL
MKKAVSSLVIIASLATSLSASAFAESVTNATYNTTNSSDVVLFEEPKYPGAGTYYEPSSTSRAERVDYSIEVTNPSNVVTEVRRDIKVRLFAELSVGGETELNIIGQKVSAKAEVKAGVDREETISVTWRIPQGRYLIQAGKVTVKTNGYLERANTAGVVTSRQYVNAHYTTKDFAKTTKLASK